MTEHNRGMSDYAPLFGMMIVFMALVVIVLVGMLLTSLFNKAYGAELKTSMMQGQAFEYLWTSRVRRDPNDGIASHYEDKLTATGELLRPYDTKRFTCAHPDPRELGQVLRIRHFDKCIVCQVNDIGPAEYLHRAIDLTPAGFKALGVHLNDGLGNVKIDRKSSCL
jgi:rare lipoprotein A (peptidoglycan hydrolase)